LFVDIMLCCFCAFKCVNVDRIPNSQVMLKWYSYPFHQFNSI
jgi:hypothetical protein